MLFILENKYNKSGRIRFSDMGAHSMVLTVTDETDVTTPMWFGAGLNHRCENGVYKRAFGEQEEWVVEFSDLQEFVGFCCKFCVEAIYASEDYAGMTVLRV